VAAAVRMAGRPGGVRKSTSARNENGVVVNLAAVLRRALTGYTGPSLKTACRPSIIFFAHGKVEANSITWKEDRKRSKLL
jgi:hypothetical protein